MNANASARPADELRTVVAQAEKLIETLQDSSDETVVKLKARATEAINTAKARLSSVRTKARDSVLDAAHAADDYVRENPWQTIAVGMVFGLFVGAFLAARRS